MSDWGPNFFEKRFSEFSEFKLCLLFIAVESLSTWGVSIFSRKAFIHANKSKQNKIETRATETPNMSFSCW